MRKLHIGAILCVTSLLLSNIHCAHEEEVGCRPEQQIPGGSLGVQVNSGSDDFAPFIDGRTLYFVSNRKGLSSAKLAEKNKFGEDMWTAEASGPGWSDVTLLPVNTIFNDGPLSLTQDRKKVYVALSYRDDQGSPTGAFGANGGGCDLYEADWPGFKNIRSLGPTVNSPFWDSQPSISPNGSALYFASNRPGGKAEGTSDIWMTMKDANGRWAPPVNLGETINTPGNEYSPFIAADGRTLYFASDGQSGHAGLDIYRTIRRSDGTWENPERLPEPFNSAKDDCFPFIDVTTGKLYIASDRDGGCGGLDLFAFQLTTPRAPVVERETYFELGKYNVPFFVTGYYCPNTRENLDQLVEWLPGKFKGLPIEDPKDKYDIYIPIIEAIFDTVRTTCVDSIFPQFIQVARSDEYLEIEVDGYVDPRPIQGKYVEEDIAYKGVNIKRGDKIDNPVLSQLRAYYTAEYLKKLFESSGEYQRLLAEGRIEFIPKGKNVDVSSGPYEAQRRISIIIRRKTR